MNTKRNRIQEILEIRGRQQLGRSFAEMLVGLLQLEQAYKSRKDVEPELLKYVPVALVACLEGFFSLAAKELIDFGSPFLDNAARLTSDIKFDFEAVRALHGKKVSMGEFIAHHLSWSHLSRIESNISALIGKSFFQELRLADNRREPKSHDTPLTLMLSDPDATFSHITKLFDLRHIICHEFGIGLKVTSEEVNDFYTHCRLFLFAANQVIIDLLYPNGPMTQAEINAASAEEFSIVLEELASLSQEFSVQLNPARAEEYRAVDKAWQRYMQLAASFEADQFKGGSLWSATKSAAGERIIREEIDLVTYWLAQNNMGSRTASS